MTATPTRTDGLPSDTTGAADDAPELVYGKGQVSFVGAGPGDPSLLTLRAVEVLSEADVVVTDSRFRAIIERHGKSGVRIIDLDGDDAPQPGTALAKAAEEGDAVVRLLPGDAATFGGLSEEAMECRQASIEFQVVPGVSPAAAVPIFAGVPTTSADVGAVHVVDASRANIDFSQWKDPSSTLILQGSRMQLAHCCAELTKQGGTNDETVVVTANGSTILQHSSELTLKAAASELKKSTDDQWPGDLVAVIGPGVRDRKQASWFEVKPLFGWRVLIPRTHQQAQPMRRQLSEHGAYCEVVPTISVEPPRTPHQIEKAVKGLVTGRYHWIGFTSVNAVKAIREKFDLFGLDARSFAGIKVAAVGGVTAGALREWGIEPDLVAQEEQSARGLLAEWPEYDEMLDPINRVFLPRADIATDVLVAGLQEQGWEVDDITAYRTVRASPPPADIRDAIKTGAFDAVLFTSSSTVRNLVGIAGKPHHTTVIACIGPATAKTAEEHGLKVAVQAPEQSSSSLIDALAEYGASLREQAIADGKPVLRPSQKRPASRRRRNTAKK